jgi:hypothetical protein
MENAQSDGGEMPPGETRHTLGLRLNEPLPVDPTDSMFPFRTQQSLPHFDDSSPERGQGDPCGGSLGRGEGPHSDVPTASSLLRNTSTQESLGAASLSVDGGTPGGGSLGRERETDSVIPDAPSLLRDNSTSGTIFSNGSLPSADSAIMDIINSFDGDPGEQTESLALHEVPRIPQMGLPAPALESAQLVV